jgi:hypothetical protein
MGSAGIGSCIAGIGIGTVGIGIGIGIENGDGGSR